MFCCYGCVGCDGGGRGCGGGGGGRGWLWESSLLLPPVLAVANRLLFVSAAYMYICIFICVLGEGGGG